MFNVVEHEAEPQAHDKGGRRNMQRDSGIYPKTSKIKHARKQTTFKIFKMEILSSMRLILREYKVFNQRKKTSNKSLQEKKEKYIRVCKIR